MNYIGSKQSLLPFLEKTILNVCGNDISEFVFCDLFAGTGTVGHYFKLKVKQVISNDLEFYSFVLNRNYIGNSRAIDSFKLLEQLRGVVGLRSYGQRDPLVEYKKEAYSLFESLLYKLKSDLVTVLLNLEVVQETNEKINNNSNKDISFKKVGRNEPCPCNSGKKYKHCHGSL